MVKKLLCLHGGGGDANSFENYMTGMLDLISVLSQSTDPYEFYFAEAPEAGSVWIRDPPGGKNNPTTQTTWADTSINYLTGYISDNGPFYGILGFSQGVPMTLLMLASGFRFEKVFLFCGYLPTTHAGLMSLINTTSPFPDKTLNFIGEQDGDFFTESGPALNDYFTNCTPVMGANTGHALPTQSGDPNAFNKVVEFAISSETTISITLSEDWNLISVNNNSLIHSEDISKIESIYTFDNDSKTYINVLDSIKNNILLDKSKGYWILLKEGNTEIILTEIN